MTIVFATAPGRRERCGAMRRVAVPFLMGCLLLSCGSESPPRGSDDAEGDAGVPPATRVVPPVSVEALLDGNAGLGCGDAILAERVEGLLSSMTLEQKVAELHGLQGNAIEGLYHAGGDAALGIPPFKMVDGPRGVRAGTATAFPVGMARGATWDPELERRVGLAMGLETRAKGGNVLLAPTINLLRHPGWGRAQETYSEDPVHMGQMALGFIGGAQNHVLASAKHFAVNSIENTRFTMSANLDERTLREVYLPHFRLSVETARVGSVMTAYNRVNGEYCAENAHLLREVLKGDWGFQGFVESDWFAGVRSTVPSALAGLDIEMPAPNFYGAPLLDAVRSGEVPEAVIDDAVRRILRQKFCFGLDADRPADPAVVESPEHRALALEVARKSIVLLRNAGDLLPLHPGATHLAVVGSLAPVANLGDRGSSSVTPSTTVSPLDGVRARLGEGRIVSLPTDTPSAADLDAIAEADVALVVVGLTYREEGEFIPVDQEFEGLARGGDRAHLGLPPEQEDLIRAVAARAKRTVVVLEAGSAVTVRGWVDAVDALLLAWYPGMEGGTALAEILFGDVNPSGRLPVTVPRSEDDLPPWDITSDEVAYGYLHGYRLLDARGLLPEYPFGFGLGYAPTALARLQVTPARAGDGETVTVSVDVHNAGTRAADEVVQIYASAPDSSVERAPRVLVGFRRVAIAPGEVVTVQIAVEPGVAFGHWDASRQAWALEATRWVLHAGTSARDLPLEAEIETG
jgi:beta-glucosidase